MGLSLSGIFACQFLEFGPFKFIIPKDSNHFCYILLIYPQNNELTKITDRLNKIEPTIDFAYEQETNTLPFLDILLINDSNKLEFNVHHKSTNKNDYIHFYSHHNSKIKSGLTIDFHLRALKIYTYKFLQNEFHYLEKSVAQFQYLKSFIQRAKIKTPKILKIIFSNNNSLYSFIILLNNSTTNIIKTKFKQPWNQNSSKVFKTN